MATSYTSLLGLALPTTGELQGTWGDTVNNSITSLLDSAVAGTTTLSTDGDVTLTTTTGAANQSRQAILLCSGARTALRTITAPAQSKIYTIINATTGGFSVKLVGVGPTTGVTIVAGESAVCAWNGSDFIKISNTGGSASFTNVTVSGTTTLSGLTASTALALNSSKEVVSVTNTGTGNNVLSASPTLTGTIGAAALTLSSDLTLSGGTANGVLYLNGSKVATSGSALTFDGSNNLLLNASAAGSQANFRVQTDTTGAVANAFFNINGTDYFRIYTSATETGLRNLQNTSMYFSVNNTEQMRLTSTGLGIGTTNPLTKLVVSNAGAEGLEISPTTGIVRLTAYNRSGGGYTSLSLIGTSGITQTIGSTGIDFNSQMLLNSSGNLGLGVTPSAWATYKAFQITNASLWGAVNNSYVGANYYFDGSVRRYISNGFASEYAQVSSEHRFYTAASGNAGDTITFTQAMTLDASGNLAIGTTSATQKLDVRGSVYVERNTNPTNAFVVQLTNQTTTSNNGCRLSFDAYNIGSASLGIPSDSASLAFYTNGNTTERARIDSSGNLGLGVTPSNWGSGVFCALEMANGTGIAAYNQTTAPSFELNANCYRDAGTGQWTRKVANAVAQLNLNQGNFYWNIAGSSTAGSTITFTQAMTLDASGNLGLGGTSTSGGRLVISQNNATQPAIYLPTDESTIQGPGANTQIRMGGNLILQSGNQTTINAKSASGVIVFGTGSSASEVARITSGGQALFGTTSENLSRWGRANFYYPSGTSNPTIALQNSTARAAGNLYGIIFSDNTDESNAAVYVRQTGNNNGADLLFGTNAGTGGATFSAISERARITSDGNFYINTTAAGGKFYVVSDLTANNGIRVDVPASFTATSIALVSATAAGTGWFFLTGESSGGSARIQIRGDGNLYNANGTYGTISDARLKQDIVDAPSQWDDLKAVRFRKYRMKEDVAANPNAAQLLGVVAQELEVVCPGLVDEHNNTNSETIKTVKTSVLLMKAAVALQEAMARIEQLEARVAQLESN